MVNEMKGWGKVKYLLHLHSHPHSFLRVPSPCFLSFFKTIIRAEDDVLYRLISNYLNVHIVDDKGRNLSSKLDFGIPPGSFLTPILVNLFLDQLDEQFDLQFGRTIGVIPHVRYYTNIFVPVFPGGIDITEEDLVQIIDGTIFSETTGDIVYNAVKLTPGKASVPFPKGFLSVNKDGVIFVTKGSPEETTFSPVPYIFLLVNRLSYSSATISTSFT